jgi:SpoVK/Ycf46/Vps4 family AAA+-type ATPase
MKNNTIESLHKYIDVNTPIIYIDDYDFARVDELIWKVCGDRGEIAEWNPASGDTRFNSKEIVGDENNMVPLREFLQEIYRANYGGRKDNDGNIVEEFIVLREVFGEIDNPEIISLLTHISQRQLYDRDYNTTIILSDYNLTIPNQLMPYVSIINVEPLKDDDVDEIKALIKQHIEENQFNREKFRPEDEEELMPSLKGLTPFEIDRILDMAMSENGTLDKDDRRMILQQKKAQVRKFGLVDLIEVEETLDSIGGLENLKEYLKRKSKVMKNIAAAIKKKITVPKGVFIVGMPGCGKSLCAKAAAAQFECPLVKLDMGSMMGKYVGQSEANLRKAIRIAEAAAPCILWIDEIEKGFSGVGGNNDIMTRMFGYFLSWMQDKKSSVYVIATANNADNLPPELKRKGRFDEIFCVDLPSESEIKAIIDVHLKKRGQKIDSLNRVATAMTGFNGADIESVINEALEELFVKQIDSSKVDEAIKLTEDNLLEVAKRTISISKSCEAQIKNMKKVFEASKFTKASKE